MLDGHRHGLFFFGSSGLDPRSGQDSASCTPLALSVGPSVQLVSCHDASFSPPFLPLSRLLSVLGLFWRRVRSACWSGIYDRSQLFPRIPLAPAFFSRWPSPVESRELIGCACVCKSIDLHEQGACAFVCIVTSVLRYCCAHPSFQKRKEAISPGNCGLTRHAVSFAAFHRASVPPLLR